MLKFKGVSHRGELFIGELNKGSNVVNQRRQLLDWKGFKTTISGS